MAPRRVLEVRSGDQDTQKWRVSLREDVFESFIAHAGDTAHKETDTEYILRAELPSATKCEVEIAGEKGKVVEISGQWRGRESESMDWKAGRWWEHGYVRRLELPEDANWKKIEAYIDDENLLQIKIPKNNSDSKALQTSAVEPKESEFV
ncbi:Small heat shock protein HSP20 protein [Dioscorea alata]|uniref:Small heat shock protein HSP20 protein n=1 Tax=Dioscorea alata TaxID=55571 RepID=A0ACB7VNF0_DIOAL|nr:Small heat shock protein HSP20 protein [Dioscorea alata]